MTWRIVQRRGLAPAALVLLAFGCSTPTDDLPPPPAIEAAKGGPGGGDPVVDAADPAQASQDTTLDVRVLGSGFDQGSQVEFLIDELPTNHVITNSTTYRNSRELRANITVSADAVTTLYDIRVTTLGGKKGIGIEKFTVTEKVSNPNTLPVGIVLPDATSDAGLFGDGLGAYLGADGAGMTSDGATDLWIQCSEGRSGVLQLPAAWASQVVPGTPITCGTRLDLNTLGDCPDGTSCPLGTAGHDPAGHYGPDISYYYYVNQPKPRGKGTIQVEYDVVWVDVTYSVTRRVGGTPCDWRVVGSQAEFWTGSPAAESQVGEVESMSLDATVSRLDALCTGP